MTLAVASGKGGTGKTTVSVHLALALQAHNEPFVLLDADVEEPNAAFFLNPRPGPGETVSIDSPVWDLSKCTACGLCAEFCRFNALALAGEKPIFFPELCHQCGGCARVCPEKAIREEPREIGRLEQADVDGGRLVIGRLKVGESRATPLIERVLKEARGVPHVLIDCPPGAACTVVSAVSSADAVLLVTEPTPFGRYDLALAVDLMRMLEKPFGVALNRAGEGDALIRDYCRDEHIPLLLEIPNDPEVARAYAHGRPVRDIRPEWDDLFYDLYQRAEALHA